MLEKVNYPKDVKKLDLKEKYELATDLRNEVLNTVSKTGGHLASNLGIVELTIALCSIFDFPKDRIVWDVGHQTYVYKLLTGRKDKFHTLRQFNGLAGFPRTSESEYDAFDTGHSSTSISAALGMARARDLLHKKNRVIAVIGDGALTGGMALEALNDAGISKTNMTVILNDNTMSISQNTGGMSQFLSKLRTKKIYIKSNNRLKTGIKKIPVIGKRVYNRFSLIKQGIKGLFIQNMFFENIGFTYLGPVDGHSIESIEEILMRSLNVEGPVLIHVITHKGEGYGPARENPNKFHGTSAFDIKTGLPLKPKKTDYSKVLGDKLVKLASKDKSIVAITAAMEEGTGLSEFAKKYPNRFFDVEIAEQHAITMAAGMAITGLKPVVPIYSSFLQRAYDQLVHDVCMTGLPVVICIDRAGIVGNDGETHQGVFDISFLNTIPNMNIMAPKDFKELEMMLEFAINLGKPVAIRYPRGSEGETKFNKHERIKYGKCELIKEGTDITIVALGKMVDTAYQVATILAQDNISVEVINARFANPIDIKKISESYTKTGTIITLEDNCISGGFGQKLKVSMKNTDNIHILGYPSEYIKHGNISDIEKKYHLDTKSVVKYVKKVLGK